MNYIPNQSPRIDLFYFPDTKWALPQVLCTLYRHHYKMRMCKEKQLKQTVNTQESRTAHFTVVLSEQAFDTNNVCTCFSLKTFYHFP